VGRARRQPLLAEARSSRRFSGQALCGADPKPRSVGPLAGKSPDRRVIPAHGAGFSSHARMRLSGAAPQSLLMARWRLPASAPEAIVSESGRFKARRLVLQIGGQVGLRKALDIGASFAALMVTGAITLALKDMQRGIGHALS